MARIKFHVRKTLKGSRKSKRIQLQNILTALEKEYNGLEVSFKVLCSRYRRIWKRHKSFPDEVRMSRYTAGKVPQIGRELTNIYLSSSRHFIRLLKTVRALKSGISQDLLVRKQAYEESHKNQVNLLKSIHKLMETSLGSCAA